MLVCCTRGAGRGDFQGIKTSVGSCYKKYVVKHGHQAKKRVALCNGAQQRNTEKSNVCVHKESTLESP